MAPVQRRNQVPVDRATSVAISQMQIDLAGSDTPVGQVTLFPSGEVLDGFFTCNGQEIDRQEFNDLWEIAQLPGNIPPFGNGDGSTTFNVPDYSGATVPSGTRYVIRAA